MKNIGIFLRFEKKGDDVELGRWYSYHILRGISKKANITLIEWRDITDGTVSQSFNWNQRAWQGESELSDLDLLHMFQPKDIINEVGRYTALLEKLGKKKHCAYVNNPKIMIDNFDKSYLLFLQEQDIPVPATQVVDSLDALLKLHNQEIIVKPLRYGESGNGVKQMCEMDYANIVAYWKKYNKRGLLAQEFIEDVCIHGEISIPVFGGNIFYAVRKVPRDGGFLTNERANGASKVIPHMLTKEQRDLAGRVIRTWSDKKDDISQSVVRIDLIGPEDKPLISEVELINPAIYTEWLPIKACEKVADKLADYLLSCSD